MKILLDECVTKRLKEFLPEFEVSTVLENGLSGINSLAPVRIVRTQKNMVFWRQHEGQESTEGRKYYIVDALKMYKDVLLNKQISLGSEEGRRCYNKIKKEKYLALFKYFFKKRRVKECYSYFKLLRGIN